jgi:hypothetical protein
MLGILIFVASFFGFFTVTTIFPILPPGSLLIHFFGSYETNFLIIGINSDLFISAIVNGFCWAIIVTLVFLFIRGPGNEKTELPIWVPRYAKSNNS